jgi:hypothetical protein
MFNTNIVSNTDAPTMNMVNNKYRPNSGTDSDVGGMISLMSKKNIVCDRSTEITSTTFSPESAGK